MFQYFDKNSIRSQESHDIFPYTIGYQEKDFSLSANVNAYCFNKTGSASASYASILTAFYPDQSLSGYIIPTSYYENKVGDQSVSSLLIFSFNSTISRDGISNINESKNVEIICSGYFVDPIAPSYIINPKGTASNQQYIIFDKKDTVTSGTIYISILKNLSVTAVLPGHSDFDYSANDVPIGRIFYDNSLIILDSFTKLNRIYDNTVGNYISIPYPKGVINFYMEDSINGDISYGDFVHNAIAYSTGISESNDTTFDIVIIIDTIKVNFKINKDLNYITFKTCQRLGQKANQVEQLINGLIRSIEKQNK